MGLYPGISVCFSIFRHPQIPLGTAVLLVTIAMLMPTFNTPSSVAVIFPSSDIPLPLFPKTSALVDLSQTLTVHLKLTLTGNG